MKRSTAKLARLAGVIFLMGLTYVYTQFRPEFADAVQLGSDTPPSAPDVVGEQGSVRVVSWNLRRLGDPKHPSNLPRLDEGLDRLEADLLAVQEIMDPEVLDDLQPQWQYALSKGGGRGHQHVGFWWDPARMQIIDAPIEIDDLTMGGSVRPGLLATFETKQGLRFAALVVHLKAKSEGQDLRERQWPLIAEAVGSQVAPDLPVVVLGDFNATGSAQMSAQAERQAIAEDLDDAGLQAVRNPSGCSAYWQGPKRDAWLEASLLDLIWTRGFAPAEAWAGAHCGVHRCQRFRSTRARPDPDYKGVSDHCPLVVDLRIGEAPTSP